jgi:hypothetical protein
MKALFIYILSIVCLVNVLQAQTYSSRKLAEVGESFPKTCLPMVDSIFNCAQITKGKSFVVKYNQKNEIVHLGVSLFSPETKEMISLPVCNFIERMMLELLLQKSSAAIHSRLREYKISLMRNNIEYGSRFFTSLSSTLNEIQNPTQFALDKDSCYTAYWEFGNNELLKMSFPISRELILGTNKKESDENIGELLMNDDCRQFQYPQTSDIVLADKLTSISGTDLYKHNGTMFLSDKINSNTHYQRLDSIYQIVFSPEYPTESLANLFLTKQIKNSLVLKITHKMYGGFTPEFTIPLNQFTRLFDKEFSTYCVLYRPDSDNVQLSVVLHNRNFNYIHLLRIKTTVEQLFLENGILTADFYTNIPQHNLKNLF